MEGDDYDSVFGPTDTDSETRRIASSSLGLQPFHLRHLGIQKYLKFLLTSQRTNIKPREHIYHYQNGHRSITISSDRVRELLEVPPGYRTDLDEVELSDLESLTDADIYNLRHHLLDPEQLNRYLVYKNILGDKKKQQVFNLRTGESEIRYLCKDTRGRTNTEYFVNKETLRRYHYLPREQKTSEESQSGSGDESSITSGEADKLWKAAAGSRRAASSSSSGVKKSQKTSGNSTSASAKASSDAKVRSSTTVSKDAKGRSSTTTSQVRQESKSKKAVTVLACSVTKKSTVATTSSGALPNRTLTQTTNKLVRVTAAGTFGSVPGLSSEDFFDLLKADTKGWSTSEIAGEEQSVYRFQPGSILAGRKEPGYTYEHIIRKKLGLPPLAKATDGFAFEVKRQLDEASKKAAREQAAARKVEADILAGFEKTASSSTATSSAPASKSSVSAAAKPPADNNSSSATNSRSKTLANAVPDREERDRRTRQRCVEEWETLCQNPSWELRSKSGTWIPHYTGDGRFKGQPENGIRIALGIHQIDYRTREPLSAFEGPEAPNPVFLRDWDLKTGKRVNSAVASSEAAPENTSSRASPSQSEKLAKWKEICADLKGWSVEEIEPGDYRGRYNGESENVLRYRLGIRTISNKTRQYLNNDVPGVESIHPRYFDSWDPKTGYFTGLAPPPKEFVSSSSSLSGRRASSSSSSTQRTAPAVVERKQQEHPQKEDSEGVEEGHEDGAGGEYDQGNGEDGEFADGGDYQDGDHEGEDLAGQAVDEDAISELTTAAFRLELSPAIKHLRGHYTGTPADFRLKYKSECPRRVCDGNKDCPRLALDPKDRKIQLFCVGCTTEDNVKLFCHCCQTVHVLSLAENIADSARQAEKRHKRK